MSRGHIPHSVPLIIGHRGASGYAPENTLAAFDMALQEGADGIEFDVRLARDRVPVVIHDASLLRTAYLERLVEEFDSTLLSQCYVGEWYNAHRPKLARESFVWEQIPTLAQVCERYGAHHLYIEMKCEQPSRRAELARVVVGLLREHGLGERVVVKSFEHDSLVEVKRLAPEVRTAALFGRSWPRPLVPAAKIIRGAEACGADEISLHRSLLRKTTVKAAQRRGFEVVVWTANSSVLLRRAVALNLRAVITDYPRYLKDVLTQKLLTREGACR
ncbi:MAG TPA: glycerophosphodiester phosphodiesterase [Pyrinomonadaceae bacterium]|jgi:glycerophosphoryl diester phosphodiesterase|nr:glycerophosphodiester phosphodiesterase [Pyrinomonadaceae bacterium]